MKQVIHCATLAQLAQACAMLARESIAFEAFADTLTIKITGF